MELQIDQKKVYCYTGGKTFDSNLPCLVFLHGAQNDHSVWALQSRYFAHHGYAVLAPDLPAHGQSEGPALSSIEAMANWLQELRSQCTARSFILIGHSMGSLIATELAARWPATGPQLHGLALLGCSFPMKVSEQLLDAALHQPELAIELVTQWSHYRANHQPSAPGPGFSIPNMSRRLMQSIWKKNQEAVFHIDFSACNNYQNGQVAAQSITQKCLFMIAKNDLMTPAKASLAYSQHFKQAQISYIAESGHAMMAEQADAVRQQLRTYFQACLAE